MDLRFTDEQRELQELARRIAEQLGIHGAAGTGQPSDGVDVSGLVETGLMGLVIDEDLGGSGASLIEGVIVAEQLGRALVPSTVVSSMLIAPGALGLLASSAERAEVAGAIANGRPASVVVGTDLSWPPGDEGFAWAWQDDAIVLAPSGAALAVSTDPVTDPRPTEDFGLLVAPVKVAGASDELADSEAAAWFLAQASVAMSGLLVGHMDAALALAVEHAASREQFRVKIGSFQAIKHMCADMFVDLESSRSAVYGAAALLASTDDAREASRTAAVAKAWCGDAALRVAETAIQVHGGLGFTWEIDVHRYLRAALAARASFLSVDGALDLITKLSTCS